MNLKTKSWMHYAANIVLTALLAGEVYSVVDGIVKKDYKYAAAYTGAALGTVALAYLNLRKSQEIERQIAINKLNNLEKIIK